MVPPKAVAAALLPAAVVVVLFFFDHGISALMARDVLRDRSRGDEKDEAATAETGAAAEEGAALEAGGRAPAKAAAAAAASPERAPTTTNLKPSAYAYDLFLCVRFLLWSERERKAEERDEERGDEQRGEEQQRKEKQEKKKKLTSSLDPSPPCTTGHLHGRRRRHGPAPDKRRPASSPDAHARAIGEFEIVISFFFPWVEAGNNFKGQKTHFFLFFDLSSKTRSPRASELGRSPRRRKSRRNRRKPRPKQQ